MKKFLCKGIIIFVAFLLLGCFLSNRIYHYEPNKAVLHGSNYYGTIRSILEKEQKMRTIYDYIELDEKLYGKYDNKELMLYSILLANKYKIGICNSYAYDKLTDIASPFMNSTQVIGHDRIIVPNIKDALALYFLFNGAEQNGHNSLMLLGDLYIQGKYVKKDTVKGTYLKHLADSTLLN